MTSATYFWSGSNHWAEIAALADQNTHIGVTATELTASGLAQLDRLCSRRATLGVTRNESGRPIIMFNRERSSQAIVPQGELAVRIAGDEAVVSFRKVAANVARIGSDAANQLGSLLKKLFGDNAGERGAGHRVVLLRTALGWELDAEANHWFGDSDSLVFIDSGAFSEVKFTAQGPVVVRPITDAKWDERLAKMTRCAEALRERAYLVAPDMVGNQRVTLERLRRYKNVVRYWRELGANIIVCIQRGEMAQADFDRECSAILGFDDYVRGIPSKKAAATPEEIGQLVSELPAGCRIHLLGLSTFGPRFDKVMAQLPADVQVFCDSVRIRAIVGRDMKGGKARPLTALNDHFAKLGETVAIKYHALRAYLQGVRV